MPRVIMVHVGELHGQRVYAAENKADEVAVDGRDTLVFDLKGQRATRTELQSRSLHLYLNNLSVAFNEAGLSVSIVLKKLFKSPNFAWSAYLVKERIWREVQKQTLGKESTTKLSTTEVSIIYDSINRATSDKLGVSVPFPDKYNLMYEKEYGVDR